MDGHTPSRSEGADCSVVEDASETVFVNDCNDGDLSTAEHMPHGVRASAWPPPPGTCLSPDPNRPHTPDALSPTQGSPRRLGRCLSRWPPTFQIQTGTGHTPSPPPPPRPHRVADGRARPCAART